MPNIPSTPTRVVALVAGSVLVLGACGSDDAGSSTDAAGQSTTTTPATADRAAEVSSPLRRLAVTDADAPRLTLIDLDEDRAEAVVDLPASASYTSSTSEDGRLLLLGHDEAVTVVDGATWSEAHGDHAHHFAGEPTVVGTVDGERPTHLISHGGTAALWFDGSGEAVLFDESDLTDGQLSEQARVQTAAPHHGFAIPYADHVIHTSPPDEEDEMPEQVVVADWSGEVESEHTCTQAHGEASWSSGAAVACADGVLLLNEDGQEWSSEIVGYESVDDTDPYGYGDARAWVLEPVGDGEHLVAPLGEHHVLTLDVATAEMAAIDIGAPVATFGVAVHEPSGLLLVLTNDGAVHLVDPDAGAVLAQAEVLEPTVEGEPDQPYRMLAVSDDDVFVSDPDSQAVAELTVGDGTLTAEATHDLGFAPAYLGVLNG